MKKTLTYYICMTDTFMSQWGKADGKINKLIITADTYAEAEIVYRNALRRSEMQYVNITTKKPAYLSSRYFVSYHDKSDYSAWFMEGKF